MVPRGLVVSHRSEHMRLSKFEARARSGMMRPVVSGRRNNMRTNAMQKLIKLYQQISPLVGARTNDAVEQV